MRITRWVILGTALITVLAACAPSTPPAPAAPTAAPQAKPPAAPAAPAAAPAPTTAAAAPAPTAAAAAPASAAAAKPAASTGPVRLIGAGALEFGSLDLAYWQDLMKKQGMTVDFKWVDAPDAALRSVVANAADAYVGSLNSAILAVKNTNANVRIVAVNNQATDYVLLSKPDINSIQDLKGRTIGIASPGSAGDTIVRTALKLKNVDPEGSRFVTIGGTGARVTALLSGQIDTAPVHAADGANAVATGKAKILMAAGENIGVYLQSALIASADWMKANPQAAQQVVDAFVDASRWAATNKDEYIALSKQALPKFSDAERANTYDLFRQIKFFPVNGGLGQEGIDRFVKLEQDTGGLPKDLPAQNKWIDDSLVKNYIGRHPVMQGN